MKKCKQHPKYKAVHAPRATDKHTQGCQLCWEIYKSKHGDKPECEDTVGGS